MQLVCDACCGNITVEVIENGHDSLLTWQRNSLEINSGVGRLLCMALRSNVKVDVGPGRIQLREEPFELIHLREVGSSPDYVQDKACHAEVPFDTFDRIRMKNGRAR